MPARQVVITATPSAMAGNNSVGAAAACNRYNRTQVCRDINIRFDVTEGTAVVGYATAKMTQSIVFSTKSRKFREYIVLKTTGVYGKATGIRAYLAVSCGNPCKAANKFPKGVLLRKGASSKGRVTYIDNVGKGKVHSTASNYTLTGIKAGYTPGVIKWKSLRYRCDDKIKNRAAGCVIPQFIPTMTAMKKLPKIAANIRRIQNKGPGHYGRPGSGHPLHRLMNKSQQNKNRRAVCGRSVVGTPPAGKSCDEYPFASTREGGKALSAANRGWAWVPTSEQNKQAGYITSSHNAQRVLDREAFYVAV